jgi:hypothetical protein
MHFDRAHLPFLRPMSFFPAPSDSISFSSDPYDFPPIVDNDSSLIIHPKQECNLSCNKTPLTLLSDSSSPLIGNRTQSSTSCTPLEGVSVQFPTGRTSSSSPTLVDLRECLSRYLRTMFEPSRKPALHSFAFGAANWDSAMVIRNPASTSGRVSYRRVTTHVPTILLPLADCKLLALTRNC